MSMNTNNLTREQIKIMRENSSAVERHKEYWTDEERQQLTELYSTGYGISELALIFKRSELAIMNQISSMGLQERTYTHKKRKTGCKCPSCVHYKDNCAKSCKEVMKEPPAIS